MRYEDIPPEIRTHIRTRPDLFDQLDEDTQDRIYDAALRSHGMIQTGSIYSQINISNVDVNEARTILNDYHRTIFPSTAGIESWGYSLREKENRLRLPSINTFLTAVIRAIDIAGARNVVFMFVSQDDIIHHISFSRKDIERYSLEQLVEMLTHPSEEWFEDLFSGSDYIMDMMKYYRLCTDRFEIVRTLVHGGYGKMFTDYYRTKGLENNNDDCLIRCFSILSKRVIDIGIRDHLKLEDGVLNIDAVHILEHHFGIQVDIYRDQRVLNIEHQRVKGTNIAFIDSFKAIIKRDDDVIIYGTGKSPHKLLFKDGHYDIIVERYEAKDCHCPYTGVFVGYHRKSSKRDILLRIKEKYLFDSENLSSVSSEDSEDAHYYFFDYETVFNREDLCLIPYACSIVKCDSNGNVIDSNVFIGMDCDEKLVCYLRMQRKDTRCYLIGYNNSRFDNYILLQSMLKHNMYINHVRFAGTSIISINAGGFIVRDLCRILNTSLDKACNDFRIDKQHTKSVLHHENYQFAYLDGGLEDYCRSHHDELYSYCIRDVMSLSRLFFLCRSSMHTLLSVDIENYYTLAGMSFKTFLSNCSYKHDLPILKKEYKPYDEFVRLAVFGGRSQMECVEANDIVSIDCVSLYPYVMLNRAFPIGYPKFTHNYVNGKIGVYSVHIHSQSHLRYNIIPLRKKNKPLDWNDKNGIDVVLCSVDIECLRRHGTRVDVHNGIYWEETINYLFDNYFRKIVDEKTRQDEWKTNGDERYNPSLREMSKLMMNSLSGKLIQRIHNNVKELCKNAVDVDRFFGRTIEGTQKFTRLYNCYIAEGKVDGQTYVPSIFGVLIYAYAREHMYENVLSKVNRLYGTDTDSAFISKKDFEINIDKRIIGDEFGQFKIEHNNINAIFVAPKCYLFYRGKDEIVKSRFKGVVLNSDKPVNDNIDIPENPIERYYLYHKLTIPNTIHFYRKLIKTKKTTLLSNNISKHINGKNNNKHSTLYLQNHCFVKEINILHHNVDISIR